MKRQRQVGNSTLAALAGLTLATTVSCSGRGVSEPVDLPSVDNVTYIGCVDPGQGPGSRLLLWTLDEPLPAGTTGESAPLNRQSTSASGPWPGTRELELVGDQSEAMASHRGHRILVAGTLEEQHGSTGQVDLLQAANGVEFRRLRASEFKVVEGPCAFDPQRMERAGGEAGHAE